MQQVVPFEMYRLIYENSMDAILLTKPDGTIWKANPAACRMFQMTEEEICAIGRSGVVDVEDPNFRSALSKRDKDGKVRAELTYLRKGSEKFPTDSTSAVFLDGSGQHWTVMIIRDISIFKQTEESLRIAQKEEEYLADHDYLTGGLNRRAFIEVLEQEMGLSSFYETPLSIIMIDIDRFKRINDALGHLAGDKVLVEFSKQIMESIPPRATLARFGGDEFILCLPNTLLKQAVSIAENLKSIIKKHRFPEVMPEGQISASFGVVQYNLSTENVDAFIASADGKMYEAKKLRNSICF